MTRPIRLGILGCARIVRRSILAGIAATPSVKLLAIASRSSDKARAFADEFKIRKHYGSYEALLADPEIDAVYIPLPNHLHHPWVLQAAAARKHVLCEKPLALTFDQATEMAEACEKHGVILMEAFMWRHHPRVERALQMLRDGMLGDLRFIHAQFSFTMDPVEDAWLLDPAMGGGALFDIGCYGVDAARLFAGAEPIEVYSRAHRHPETGVDMSILATLCFSNGIMASIDASLESVDRNRLELVGTKGTLEFPDSFLPGNPSLLRFTHSMGTEEIPIEPVDQYAKELKLFADSIRAGKILAPAENGVANTQVIDAIRTAAGLGN